jgi:hypothetical protein
MLLAFAPRDAAGLLTFAAGVEHWLHERACFCSACPGKKSAQGRCERAATVQNAAKIEKIVSVWFSKRELAGRQSARKSPS